MTPESFVELLGREKASAILRTNSQEKAAKAMEAAGSRCMPELLSGRVSARSWNTCAGTLPGRLYRPNVCR